MGLASQIVYGIATGGFFVTAWESFAVYYGENSIFHQCVAFSGCPSNFAQGASNASDVILILGIASIALGIATLYKGFFWKDRNAPVVPSDTSSVDVLPPGMKALPKSVPVEADEPKLDYLLENIESATQKQGAALDDLSSNANVMMGFLSLELVGVLTAAFTSIVRINALVGVYAFVVLLGAGFALISCLFSNLDRSRPDPTTYADKLANSSLHQLKWDEVRIGFHDFGWNEFSALEIVNVFKVGICLFIIGNLLLVSAIALR